MDAKRNPRWSDELLELCKPELFSVEVWPAGMITGFLDKLVEAGFTREESLNIWDRLQPKLGLVAQRAAKMAANQLKGTLKYLSDNRTAAEWLQMLEDDLTDTLNYVDLLKDGLEREQSAEQIRSLRKDWG